MLRHPIEAYMEAIPAMQFTYGEAMTAFLARPSNLYSIQLRPRAQDGQSMVVNPAFTIKRRNTAAGSIAPQDYYQKSLITLAMV